MLIFDIGYNHGNFTKRILDLYPESTIIGVEGHPIYHEIFKSKPIPNVHLIEALVSDKSGEFIPFYICDSNPGINSINPDWIKRIRHNHFFEKTKRELFVKTLTIDNLISEYGKPDIIKMDIEGAEPIALKGLSQKCGLITFEWAEEVFDETLECVCLLKRLGYNEFSYSEESDFFCPDLKYYPWEELQMEKDIIPDRKKRWGMIYTK